MKEDRMPRMQPFVSLLLIGMLCLGAAPAFASEMDLLLNKLVEKEILTEAEAREIRSEVKAEVRRETEARKQAVREEVRQQVAQAAPISSTGGRELPAWIRNSKFFGDIRLRYEGQFKNYTVNRHRERIRLRLGFKTQPVEDLEVGVRLASGGTGSPISTNQTITDSFTRKPFDIDWAYAKWTPTDYVAVTAGKMANPFQKTDIIWDGDVTPEGAALKIGTPQEKDWPIRPFVTFGAFQVDELGGDNGDPGLLAVQIGAQTDVPGAEDWSWSPSVAFYDFTGISSKTAASITGAPGGNTLLFNGAFRDDYDLLNFISKLKIPSLPVLEKPITLITDYTVNTAANDDGGAWQTGFELGKVTEKFGSWKGFYYFKRLESDAVFGALTDGDFGLGGTGHVGHKLGARMGLKRNWDVGLTYYRVDDIEPTAGVERRNNVVQVETIVKF
jgi:hypothetical protein